MSRITADLTDGLLAKAMRASRAKTKRETLERGLSALIRDAHIERLRSKLGAGAITWTLPTLRRWRHAGDARAR